MEYNLPNNQIKYIFVKNNIQPIFFSRRIKLKFSIGKFQIPLLVEARLIFDWTGPRSVLSAHHSHIIVQGEVAVAVVLFTAIRATHLNT